jgi:hypothetical protein
VETPRPDEVSEREAVLRPVHRTTYLSRPSRSRGL